MILSSPAGCQARLDFGRHFVFEKSFSNDLSLFQRQLDQRGLNTGFLLCDFENPNNLDRNVRLSGSVEHQSVEMTFAPQKVDALVGVTTQCASTLRDQVVPAKKIFGRLSGILPSKADGGSSLAQPPRQIVASTTTRLVETDMIPFITSVQRFYRV